MMNNQHFKQQNTRKIESLDFATGSGSEEEINYSRRTSLIAQCFTQDESQDLNNGTETQNDIPGSGSVPMSEIESRSVVQVCALDSQDDSVNSEYGSVVQHGLPGSSGKTTVDTSNPDIRQALCDICSRAGVAKNSVSAVEASELLKLRNVHFQDRVLNKEVRPYEELDDPS